MQPIDRPTGQPYQWSRTTTDNNTKGSRTDKDCPNETVKKPPIIDRQNSVILLVRSQLQSLNDDRPLPVGFLLATYHHGEEERVSRDTVGWHPPLSFSHCSKLHLARRLAPHRVHIITLYDVPSYRTPPYYHHHHHQ